MACSHKLLLAFAAYCSTSASSAPTLRRAPLSTWRFRSLNGSISIPNATTPGTSHTHLLDGGVITEDLYRRFNEVDTRWIAQTTWVYEMPLSVAVVGDARVVFETLDGVAHVALNGESLGAPAVNAFQPHAFALLRNDTGDNILQVVFTPPLEYTQQAAAAYPYEVPATRHINVWAEPSYRPFLRKAASDFGWDWGPAYATSGIAGPVFVEWISSAEETTDVSVVARLDDLDDSVSSLSYVTLRLSLDGERHGDDIRVDLADTVTAASFTVSAKASLPFAIKNPTLWWPSGHGEPHLYNVRVDAFADDGATPLATLSHRVGFRSIELVQQPTQAGGVTGETFFFRINGVPLFMKGANWIPNDSFPTRVAFDKIARRFHVPFPFLDESWLATPLDGDFEINVTTRVGAFLYLTQIQQGLCYQTAIETWRRGKNPVRGGGTMGILYWQLNDVWQGMSWSSIEFDGRWKSLQYAALRAYAPVLVSVVQTTDHELTDVGVNDLKGKDLAMQFVYEVVTTDTGCVVHAFQAMATLTRLSSELLDNVTVSALLTKLCDATHYFLRLRFDTGDPNVACGDAFFFFAPFKHLALRHGRVTITSVTASSVADGDNHTAFDVALQTDGFVALFVEVEAPRVLGLWDRNSFHLVGNASQTLRFVTRENLTRDAFQPQPELRWLQQTYETEATISVA